MGLFDFFNAYFNFIKVMKETRREYREQMARVRALPEDYRYVYEKIRKYMWMYSSGNGLDMLKIQYDLVDLFEEGASDGRKVLEITGEDAAAFCDELLRNSGAKLWTEKWKDDMNRDLAEKLGKERGELGKDE